MNYDSVQRFSFCTKLNMFNDADSMVNKYFIRLCKNGLSSRIVSYMCVCVCLFICPVFQTIYMLLCTTLCIVVISLGTNVLLLLMLYKKLPFTIFVQCIYITYIDPNPSLCIIIVMCSRYVVFLILHSNRKLMKYVCRYFLLCILHAKTYI